MNVEDYFVLGYVSKTIGLKGEIGVKIQKGEPIPTAILILKINNQLQSFPINKTSPRSNGITAIQLKDIKTIEKAEELIGSEIYHPFDKASPETIGTDFYTAQIKGYILHDTVHGELGSVDDVLQFPQQRIFQVKKGFKEILIPAVADFIIKIDHTSRTIYVKTPEGLVDLYLVTNSQEEA